MPETEPAPHPDSAREPNATIQPHTLPADEVVARLATDPQLGLTSTEAEKRLADSGPNRLHEERVTPAWQRFLRQFQDFMIYVLVGAVAIAAWQGDVIEAVAILAILLLNGVLGFLQESKAQSALAALKQLSAPVATVVRDSEEADIPAEDLVPGDIVLLEAGDSIPADGRLIEAAALRVMESALTGESEASLKDAAATSAADAPLGEQTSMVFAGTAVAVGRGRLVVTSTGQRTQMGRIADLLASTKETETPLQLELDRVGKRIALLVLAIAAIVFIEEGIVAFRTLHEASLGAAFADVAFRVAVTNGLLVAVSLAVAAIPEGLPAIVTVALSLGVRRMAERHAIVRRLHAVETLGSTTFICTDKTGTLTRNEMAVRRMLVGVDALRVTHDAGIEPAASAPHPPDLALLLEMAAANNDAHVGADGVLLGDPTETALLAAAQSLAPGHLRPLRVDELPFDSQRKRMTTIHDIDGTRTAFTKGGADVVLALCDNALLRGEIVPLDDELRARIQAENASFADTGFRTLAFAMRELGSREAAGGDAAAEAPAHPAPLDPAVIERALTYVGVLGLVDPPRAEVPAALAECRRAGIHVAMITGDHALTARAIARDIGLLEAVGGGMTSERVIEGPEIEAMSDEDLEAAVCDTRVYARVNPDHKLRIVEALKRRGEVVAMTGDGVNDAPALKRADIGIAMGRVGTDVARDASDLVLADDDFATIVHAVEQGRAVYDNLRKVILFLLSCNMSEVLVVFLTALFSPTTALLPLQLLWINLVTDGLPALALGVDPSDPGVMDRPPRDARESILSAKRQLQVAWQGFIMTAGVLTLYYWVAPHIPGTTPAEARTMLFTALVLSQLLHAFDFRRAGSTVWHVSSLKNRWLVLSLCGSMALQAAIIYVPALSQIFKTAPLSGTQWVAVLGAAVLAVSVIDVTKILTNRRDATQGVRP
jgi:P-type Ca2+ transporter type 2C